MGFSLGSLDFNLSGFSSIEALRSRMGLGTVFYLPNMGATRGSLYEVVECCPFVWARRIEPVGGSRVI